METRNNINDFFNSVLSEKRKVLYLQAQTFESDQGNPKILKVN